MRDKPGGAIGPRNNDLHAKNPVCFDDAMLDILGTVYTLASCTHNGEEDHLTVFRSSL